MKVPRLLVAAAASAAMAAGCGGDESSKCPTDSPQVEAMATGCTAVAGQPMTYPLRLCPACNLSNVTCDVQMSGNQIFLNPTAEACESPSSCSTSCLAQPTSCTFTAPAAADDYTVIVFDPTAGTRSDTLHVVPDGQGQASCTL